MVDNCSETADSTALEVWIDSEIAPDLSYNH